MLLQLCVAPFRSMSLHRANAPFLKRLPTDSTIPTSQVLSASRRRRFAITLRVYSTRFRSSTVMRPSYEHAMPDSAPDWALAEIGTAVPGFPRDKFVRPGLSPHYRLGSNSHPCLRERKLRPRKHEV